MNFTLLTFGDVAAIVLIQFTKLFSDLLLSLGKYFVLVLAQIKCGEGR